MLETFDIAGIIEAGTDEAGRGCIAGPVYAAAVILPADFNDPGLNDSKQLSRRERERLRDIIVKEAMSWCVASASPEEIDDVNILNASIREAATQYPQYGWEVNCGYPTKAHREAVMRYGITPLHRKSFKILPDPELF